MLGAPEASRRFNLSPPCPELKGRGTDDLHRRGGVCRAELLVLCPHGEKERSQERTRLSLCSGAWHTPQAWLWSCCTNLELHLRQRCLRLMRAVWKPSAWWWGEEPCWCGAVSPTGAHGHCDGTRVHKQCFVSPGHPRKELPNPGLKLEWAQN